MSDDQRGFDAVPPSFFLGACISGLSLHLQMMCSLASYRYTSSMSLLAGVLYAHGMLTLASRRTGAARIGLIIAGVGWLVSLANGYLSTYFYQGGRSEFVEIAMAVFSSLLGLATLGGLVVAAAHRHLAGKIVAAVVVLTLYESPVRALLLHHALGTEGYVRVFAAIGMIRLGVLLWLTFSAARGADVRDLDRASRGFRHAARGMRIGLVGIIAGVLFALLTPGHGTLHQPVMTAVAVVCTVGFAWCGIGLLQAGRSGIDELGRYPLAIAGVFALWAAAVVFTEMIAPRLQSAILRSSRDASLSDAGALAMLMLVLVSSIVAAAAIRGFARRRDLPELQSLAAARMTWISIMIALSAVLWVMSLSSSSSQTTVLIAVLCPLSTLELMARLCRAAARALGPELPAARVVSAV